MKIRKTKIKELNKVLSEWSFILDMIGHVILAAIIGTTVAVPYPLSKSLY